ncbi:MAG: hypothetical protein ACYC1U_10540, partial [Candidatus Aquicultorales bacterium]
QDLIEDDVKREMQWPPRKEAYGDSRFMELCKLDSRNEGIIHSYSKAAELAPPKSEKAIEAKRALATHLYLLERLDEAWAVASSLSLSDWAGNPYRDGCLDALCSKLVESNRSDEALALLNQDIAKAIPEEARLLGDTWYIKAHVESLAGDRDNAASSLLKAIKAKPTLRERATNDSRLKDLLTYEIPNHTTGKNVLERIVGWSRRKPTMDKLQ